ncbi:metal-sensitive transcriptional regulator [Klugiella xanthotipulae]|uniref:DNA-binding FrmR family transcriptional regulator n=1 Tax=Klugiella xanthotipulae TaxID=244735 RepID=A0A543I5V9_9MICO|nr:metal-sensitive transcriptional regulator [Klugiella xanthotipulae]TQM65954.1 DNA-binding FrmR family transcriptional regulator [Klugiella xanthotipulae]
MAHVAPGAAASGSHAGSDEQRRKVANRLKRAQGQLAAVIAAVESGGDCRAVITQLAAVSSAIDRAGFAVVAGALTDCLATQEEGGPSDGPTVDELEKLFLSLA